MRASGEADREADDVVLAAADNYMYVWKCYNKFVILYDNIETQICKHCTVDLFMLRVGGKSKKCLGTSEHWRSWESYTCRCFKGKRCLACSSWNAGNGCSS